jgi:hypothetical protein
MPPSMNSQLLVAYVVLGVVLLKPLLVRARVIPPECARCGLVFERRELGQPVCTCSR